MPKDYFEIVEVEEEVLCEDERHAKVIEFVYQVGLCKNYTYLQHLKANIFVQWENKVWGQIFVKFCLIWTYKFKYIDICPHTLNQWTKEHLTYRFVFVIE